MSDFARFMKRNKTQRENVKFAPTRSLSDGKGIPLEWEFRPLSTRENEDIREACTREIPIAGKQNAFRSRVDTNLYIARMIAASVVSPDLYDAELQDSYGVAKPEDLLREMVDDPGEYQELAVFIQKYNGFDVGMEERIETAKK